MKRQLLLVLIALLLVSSLASGCLSQRRPVPDVTPTPQQRPAPGVTPQPQPLPGTTDGPGNRVPGPADTTRDSKRAEVLADRIKDLNDVTDAMVIVSGDTAYVGVDIAAGMQGRMTDQLKERVIDRAKQTDTLLSNVYVSADVDTMTRLKNYARDIQDGKPISGIIQQVDEMFRRPAPMVR